MIQQKNKDLSSEAVENKFLSAVEVLDKKYGLKKTMAEEMCIDVEGNPLPWYTYPAIEYLKQLDFSQKRIFEFGSGNSTLFWSLVAKEVVSIEDNEDWYHSRLKEKKENMKMLLEKDPSDYSGGVLRQQGVFDVIVVDGSVRDKCCQAALQKLTQGGLIILDNSDWGSVVSEIGEAIKILKKADLIQVDFCGFGPINDYPWATSFFFSRDFNFASKNDYAQPINITGGIHQQKDMG